MVLVDADGIRQIMFFQYKSNKSWWSKAMDVASVESMPTDKGFDCVSKYFPKVGMIGAHRSMGLRCIALHVDEKKLGQLQKNHLRFFVQPNGTVDSVQDVDLDSRQMIIYPGTHDKGEPVAKVLSAEEFSRLKAIITSPEFRDLRAENQQVGMDGCTYFVEMDVDGNYMWKDRWGALEPPLDDLRKLMRNLKFSR